MLMRTPAYLRGATGGLKPWTDSDRDRLADIYLAVPRPPLDVMMTALDRSGQAITTEAGRMGLTAPGVQLRKCNVSDEVLVDLDRQPHLPPLRARHRTGVRMMTAIVVDILDRLRPLPELVTSERLVRFGCDTYRVRNVVDRKTGIGTVKIIEEDSGLTVMIRACGHDDSYLVDTAITCWRAGIYRGRAQMEEAMR